MYNVIKNTVLNYLCLKKECIDNGFENKLDVFDLFMNEVMELNESVKDINISIANKLDTDLTDNQIAKETINFHEEQLLNEMADVLLTASRLIQEFELEEPFVEMLQFKYERQVGRELKRFKNNDNEEV